jgi:hypothetical protein
VLDALHDGSVRVPRLPIDTASGKLRITWFEAHNGAEIGKCKSAPTCACANTAWLSCQKTFPMSDADIHLGCGLCFCALARACLKVDPKLLRMCNGNGDQQW